jgi:hypothetical protein
VVKKKFLEAVDVDRSDDTKEGGVLSDGFERDRVVEFGKRRTGERCCRF